VGGWWWTEGGKDPAEKKWNAGPCQRFFWAAFLKGGSCTAVKLCEWFYIAVVTIVTVVTIVVTINKIIWEWRMAALWLRCESCCEHFQSDAGNILFFSRRGQRDKKYFNFFLDQYSRWKPRKTVIRVWRLSDLLYAAALAREELAFRRYCTIFSFKKKFRLKKRDQEVSPNKETKKRGNGCTTCNILGKDVKIRKYTFKLFWPRSKFFGQIFQTSLPKSLCDAHLPLFKFIVMCHLNLSHLTNVNLA